MVQILGNVSITSDSHIAPPDFGASCAFADLDGDGHLDLFLTNYVRFGPETTPQLCPKNGTMAACPPRQYPLLRSVVYRNEGKGRFRAVTQPWAMQTSGNSLGVAVADFNGSGHPGVAVANDEMAGDLFVPRAAGGFENIAQAAGVAYDRYGHSHAGMGIDWGDADNDGHPDLIVTTFAHEDKTLYHNLGGRVFEERGMESGVASALEPYVSFGVKFADFDNDGWLDLIVASGHVEDNVAKTHPGESYRQPVEILRNAGTSPLLYRRITASAGQGKLPPIVGRGLAIGDFDNDGRTDALIVDSEGAPLLLHNQTTPVGQWIGFSLTGTGRSNRDAYGALVTVFLTNGQTLTRFCHADGSYLSSSDKRVLIGLGNASVKSVAVRWPDGRREYWSNPQIGRYNPLTEGRGTTKATR
jgi:hypothetical protein